MRISLARALYMKPKYLLLDEPTNHLDLDGIIWLTDYLKKWTNTFVIVSHDKFFIDELCDNIIHIDNLKLNYYNHGYTKFEKAYSQKIKEIEKQYKLQKNKINELKKKHYSSDDILDKIGTKIELPKKYKVNINFPDPGSIKSINIISFKGVNFSYNNDTNLLFDNIDFYVDTNTRIALVGKNGVGKSTFLKLLSGKLLPLNGSITRDTRSRIYYYDQHSTQIMNNDLTMIEYIQKIDNSIKIEDIRKLLGTIGFDGKIHNQKIGALSGGQKMKLQFIPINIQKPHLLLLDEPTNNLDLESINSLINGINNFNGGVIVISHNINLIKKINCEIRLIDDKKIKTVDFDLYCDSILNQF